MRIQKGLTVALLALCVLSCGEEGDPEQLISADMIQALASVNDTLYLADYWHGLWKLNNKTQSWEWMDTMKAYNLFADEKTLYIVSSEVYRLDPNDGTPQRIRIPKRRLGGNVAFAVDGDTTYMAAKGLIFRSENHGTDWHQLPPRPWDDGLGHWGFIAERSLAVKGNAIYMTTPQAVLGGPVEGGKQWTSITKGLHENGLVTNLLISKNTLYAGTNKGVYRLQIGADSWIPAGLDDRFVTSIVASPTRLYIGTWQEGVFRSDDGGKNWQNIGLDGLNVRTLGVFNNQLYAGMRGGGGVLYTDDEGATWHSLNKGLNLPTDEE